MTTFMEDLQEVLKKHDARLDSCGCCGGIAVEIGGKHEGDYTSISWDPPPEPPKPPHVHDWGEETSDTPLLISIRHCTDPECYATKRTLA